MEITNKEKNDHQERNPLTKVLVGGAPLNMEFCQKIGADFYSRDPQGAVEYLKTL